MDMLVNRKRQREAVFLHFTWAVLEMIRGAIRAAEELDKPIIIRIAERTA